jgi:predicted S18 family serine protease
MFKVIKKILCLLLITATLAPAAPKDGSDWNNVEIVIRGDYYRAASAAFADYSKLLMKRAKKSASGDGPGDQKLTEYLSSIDHFNFQVGLGHGRYQVWILARASEDFPVIFGGDAFYVIDAKEFKIVEKHYGK